MAAAAQNIKKIAMALTKTTQPVQRNGRDLAAVLRQLRQKSHMKEGVHCGAVVMTAGVIELTSRHICPIIELTSLAVFQDRSRH